MIQKAHTGACYILSQNTGKKTGTIMTIEHVLNWGLSNLAIEWWFLIFI